MKKFILGLAALGIATSAMATPTVGVIDTIVNNTYKMSVQSKNFTPEGYAPGSKITNDGREHGDATIASVIDGAHGKDINILHANFFAQTPTGLATDWDMAKHALDWFKANNVKYVCTNFVGSDNQGSRGFVDYAEKLGLILVTAIGNGETKTPYPALDPRTIAVGPNDQYMRGILAPSLLRIAKYNADSKAAGTKDNAPTGGTSFSMARICGKLAVNN